MNPIWFLAMRYFRSKRHHPFIHVIRRVSVAGVTVGVTALIVVLAVMSGFEKDLTRRIIGTYAHASIMSTHVFQPSENFTKELFKISPRIRALSPFVQGQVLLERKKSIEGVLLRGADFETESAVSNVGRYIQKGRFPDPDADEFMIGRILAAQFNLKVGDTVSIISPATRKPHPSVVSGIFESGMYEYDAHLIYTPLALGQRLFDLKGGVTGVAIRFQNADDALTEKNKLNQALSYPFYVQTWMDMNRNLFEALKLERTVMFTILTLIVLVACFNITGTLTLLVIDKTRDIGILKSLGATRGQIMGIFTWNGLMTGLIGTGFGVLLGVGVCFLLEAYPIIQLPSEIYYFENMPVYLKWHDVAIIAGCAVALSLVSTLYPARAGASMKAVEALRYRE